MNRVVGTVALLIALSSPFAGAQSGMKGAVPEAAPLVATGTIPLPNVKGRIDHFSHDDKGRLFVSALGNNTVEVIDLSGGLVARTITGIPHPQGLAYAPDFNKLFAASDQGKLYIYDGTSFNLI